MAEVLLFHHAHGLTSGVRDFAGLLRRAGHVVHTPDLYDGHVFEELKDGIAYAARAGFDTIIARGVEAAEALPNELVYAGFSLGVLPAQKLAQTRDGAIGALLFHSFVPVSELGDRWPPGVGVQIHGMERDALFVDEGELDAARALVEADLNAELFLYPGNKHLFADSSLLSYDRSAAALLVERVLAFLDNVELCSGPATG